MDMADLHRWREMQNYVPLCNEVWQDEQRQLMSTEGQNWWRSMIVTLEGMESVVVMSGE